MSKFGVIIADPPWSFSDRLAMSDVKRGAEAQYDVLDSRAIIKLPLVDIAADNAVLVLWYPSSLLSEAYCCMQDWGFQQKQIWDWVKTSVKEPFTSDMDDEHDKYLWEEDAEVSDELRMAFGMGRLARNCSEHMLVGVRGKVYPDLVAKNVRNVFLAPNRKHSAKPRKVQQALDRMFPSYKKLELFAREEMQGWTAVGNECPSSMGEDIRDSIERLKQESF